jgi:molecular chaperone DnaK (HSP70)
MAPNHRYRYIIGIDLGTTNSSVSYIDCAGDDNSIETFKIPQLTAPGEISALTVLPSFLYIPGEHELHPEALSVPWSIDAPYIVGSFARDQGTHVPKRMVSSAKSWLCHERVNRKDRILPWGSDSEIPKMSPVSATAAYLNHIKAAWNHAQGDSEECYLENQMVILTVPASFDEVARDLTVEAARQAGIEQVTLLEEPLAAFYHWLSKHEQTWHQYIHPGELILVCDIGGGTTDFTLITLRKKREKLTFDRIAVGDHLILGGDNMDLALARRLEMRLKKGRKGSLSAALWKSLCHQCRDAKEKILSGTSDSEVITLVGESRRLIADTVSTSLNREETESIIVDGFLPLVEPDASLSETPRRGITEFGLPYAQEPAITRHLIRFLCRHRADVAELLGGDSVRPDHILFNGGALKPAAVQSRIRQALQLRFEETDADIPRVLVNSELDLAVSLGAGYYGRVRQGFGVWVGSGSPRAFYLGVGKVENESVESTSAICLVERGMEEGRRIVLDNQFQVVANRPVSFDLYSSSFRVGDRIGDIISVDGSVTPLAPIRTVIQFGKKTKKTKVSVTVEAHYTEVGTLSLWCQSARTEHRWRLQFQLRDSAQEILVSDREVFEEADVNDAVEQLNIVFSDNKGSNGSPERLVKSVSNIVKRPKDKWPLSFLRRMTEQLLALAGARRRSALHESRWLNLTGFCLRPGFGEALDVHRVQGLWKIHHAGPLHKKDPQVRSEWWVLWRRVAGGLGSSQQRQLLQDLSPLLKLKKRSVQKRLTTQEHLEMWMLLANLERLPAHEKENWGNLLLETLGPKKTRPQYWWTLSRIGAREPFYGPIERVVSAETVSVWIERILSVSWRNPKPAARALSQLARLTGDRKRDLDTSMLQRVLHWLDTHGGFETYKKPLIKITPIMALEESAIFGESLPPGILLHDSSVD